MSLEHPSIFFSSKKCLDLSMERIRSWEYLTRLEPRKKLLKWEWIKQFPDNFGACQSSTSRYVEPTHIPKHLGLTQEDFTWVMNRMFGFFFVGRTFSEIFLENYKITIRSISFTKPEKRDYILLIFFGKIHKLFFRTRRLIIHLITTPKYSVSFFLFLWWWWWILLLTEIKKQNTISFIKVA